MDFTIPKTHQLFHRMVQEFAEQEVRPVAKQVDVQGWPDMNVVRKLGENGLLGVPFPQKYGGSGLGELGYCLLMETMGAVCTSTATTIGAHIGIGAMSIYLGGTEAQKRKYLPDLATGKKIAAFCLTEPGAGSDAAAIKTRAIRDGRQVHHLRLQDLHHQRPDRRHLHRPGRHRPGPGRARRCDRVHRRERHAGAGRSARSSTRWASTAAPRRRSSSTRWWCRRPTCWARWAPASSPSWPRSTPGGWGWARRAWAARRRRWTPCAATPPAAPSSAKPSARSRPIQWIIANTATEVEALRSLVYRTAWMVDTGQPYITRGRHVQAARV